jgi:alkanesulfonate monooxygenase SsuD/methylene tetrahydromethanopterin reductase-like flavin-dependent oxidoreductase (luciferase family)
MALGDLCADPHTGVTVSRRDRFRSFVDLAVLAEAVGFDSVWLGEHHFCDYVLSTPPVVLAAIAERTERVRLGTAVTLLPNLDPVRAAEDYGALDLLSDGRVEIVVGRGIVDRVYEGFGQDPADARALMQEHLELLLRIWTAGPGEGTTWTSPSGAGRPSMERLRVEPHPLQDPHPPVWVAGGSSHESADLAARLGLGLMLPSVLTPPQSFQATVDRYREGFRPRPGGPAGPTVGACSHVHVAADGATARERWAPYHLGYFAWLVSVLASEGGVRRSLPPWSFEDLITGPSVCGGPAEVIDRIGAMVDDVGLDVHLAMFDHGGLPTEVVHETVARYGSEVIPALVTDRSRAGARQT